MNRKQCKGECLLDATESGVTASWSYGDLTSVTLGALKPPRVEWWIDLDSSVNALLPTVGDRSDRMLVLATGAPKPRVIPPCEQGGN